MPTYRYQCLECAAIIETMHGMDAAVPNCFECGGVLKIKWDQVASFPNRYSIMAPRARRGDGNTGINKTVYSDNQLPINESHFWSKIRTGDIDACWPFIGGVNKTTGYGHYHIGCRPNRITRGAHRVAYALHNGMWPSNMILHKCHNRRCCNPAHLYEGTHIENMQDMVNAGKSMKGVTNNKNKLTEDTVRFIRQSSEDNKTLGRKFHVSVATISSIRTGRIWGWFEPSLIPGKAPVYGKSKFQGVKKTKSGAWGAYVYVKSKQIWLGSFPTEKEAAKHRDVYVTEHGLDLTLNFV